MWFLNSKNKPVISSLSQTLLFAFAFFFFKISGFILKIERQFDKLKKISLLNTNHPGQFSQILEGCFLYLRHIASLIFRT